MLSPPTPCVASGGNSRYLQFDPTGSQAGPAVVSGDASVFGYPINVEDPEKRSQNTNTFSDFSQKKNVFSKKTAAENSAHLSN